MHTFHLDMSFQPIVFNPFGFSHNFLLFCPWCTMFISVRDNISAMSEFPLTQHLWEELFVAIFLLTLYQKSSLLNMYTYKRSDKLCRELVNTGPLYPVVYHLSMLLLRLIYTSASCSSPSKPPITQHAPPKKT